jgi:3-oxoacyl-[acyl-carrier-protein] synthase II
MIIDISAGHISMKHNFRGPNFSTVSACASSTNAIIDAFNYIRLGKADVMVSGGSEAAITAAGIGGFNAMKALSERNDSPETASRPFDLNRDGFVMGEGAGGLVLEELEHAKARGAKIYAELVGFGMSGDAYHMTSPPEDGAGAALAMENALNDAQVNAEQVGYINAHGTSTNAGDKAETSAVKSIFGNAAKDVMVGSSKSMMGHLLGAAGSVESIISILSLTDQKVSPTINLDNPDEGCDLDYIAHTARDAKLDFALCNSFGFGGTNGSLLFKKV